MNWEAIGAVGEVVGAVAVVVTLIYLTVQLRQNTQSAQNASWQSITRQLSDLDVTEAVDPELSTFFKIAEESPEDISPEQYWKFTRLAQPRLGAIEYAYLASKKGTIDDFFWEAIHPYTKHLMRKPGYRKFWMEFKADMYHPDFIEFVDQMIVEMDGA